MLAMLRVSERGRRSARTSMISPMFEPMKSSSVGARLALDDVVAVAGVPLEAVVAAAEEGAVGALVAVDVVVAVAAEEQVGAVAAARIVVPVEPPSIVSARERGEVADGRDRVRAVEAEQDEALDRGRVEPRGERRDRADLGAVGDHVDRVGLGGAAVPGDVGAVAAVDVVARRAEDLAAGRDRVLAAERGDVDVVERRLGALDDAPPRRGRRRSGTRRARRG